MKKQHISAGAHKNFSKKLEATDIFRKFANGTLTLRGCFKTLRKKVTDLVASLINIASICIWIVRDWV